jgi:hypothetical protein
MMTWGILDANRDEVGTRYNDYTAAYQEWKSLHGYMICFLVRWMADDFFIVLEPQK